MRKVQPVGQAVGITAVWLGLQYPRNRYQEPMGEILVPYRWDTRNLFVGLPYRWDTYGWVSTTLQVGHQEPVDEILVPYG